MILRIDNKTNNEEVQSKSRVFKYEGVNKKNYLRGIKINSSVPK